MAITLTFTPSSSDLSLVWINATTDVIPKFDVFVPGAADGDTLTIRIANNSGFTSPATYTTTISSAEYAAHEAVVSGGFAPLSNGTWYADAQVNGGTRSVAQSYVINADTTGPVLSAPIGTGLTYSTATVGATTDEGNGTLYYVVTTSSTQPSVAQIIAGQNHLGAAAPMSGNKVVTAAGAQVFNLTGVSDPGGTIYAHLVQKDTIGNPSNRVTSAGFTIPAASGTAFHPTALVVGTAVTLSNSDRTILTTQNATVARSLVAYTAKRNLAFTLNAANASAAVLPVITNASGVGPSPGFDDTVTNACIVWYYNGWLIRNGAVLFTGPTIAVGNTVGACVDHGAKVFWLTNDGTTFYGGGGTSYTRAQVEAGTGGIDYTSTATIGPVYAGAGSTGGAGAGTQWTMLTTWPWTAVSGYTTLG
jgi:hypothetical protein